MGSACVEMHACIRGRVTSTRSGTAFADDGGTLTSGPPRQSSQPLGPAECLGASGQVGIGWGCSYPGTDASLSNPPQRLPIAMPPCPGDHSNPAETEARMQVSTRDCYECARIVHVHACVLIYWRHGAVDASMPPSAPAWVALSWHCLTTRARKIWL